MLGLSMLGLVHTLVSLVALASGFWLLLKYREITSRTTLGRVYLITTAITALTAFGIFNQGKFGPAHALAVLTLLALVAGLIVSSAGLFKSWTRHAQAVCYSATILFHMIPGVTETLTRLPATRANFPNPEAAGFKPIYGVLLLCFIVGLIFQLRSFKNSPEAK
ncbi:hypothetical protein [Variovorax sp. PCZ-1]|uniref:hypothetical protein n=1 Tax=Variovorax sp. PCZ-1 TaxID=2835533 RepID=UPI001BCC5A8E|nr:hypothetical protein [Variovorax sp. PCZ-1]MBS7806068.1 hypothetical protein [Variovorax sp. PCZ-1]